MLKKTIFQEQLYLSYYSTINLQEKNTVYLKKRVVSTTIYKKNKFFTILKVKIKLYSFYVNTFIE